MKNKTVYIEPQRLLGFRLLKNGVIESTREANGSDRKVNISAIKSRVGGGKVGQGKD